MFACLGKLVHSSFLQTVYHRFCQVKPNISPSRYPLASSCYHGDFMQILVPRSSVNKMMVLVLVQFWVWSWKIWWRYNWYRSFFFLFSGRLRSLFTCPRCNYFVWSTILKKIMWGVSRFINYELMHTKRSQNPFLTVCFPVLENDFLSLIQ